MTRNNADFQQPLKVYRGLAYVENPETSTLGIHWTTSSNVAHDFANDEPVGDYSEEGPAPVGVILEGEVHPKHVIQPETEEFSNVAEAAGAGVPWEREKTIRPGAPIRVTRHHYIKDGQIVRSEDVNYEGRA